MFRSLQIKVNGDDQLPPVIVLDSDDHIEIAFDELADERRYLRYRLMHCDALWNPSRLVEQEFLDGNNTVKKHILGKISYAKTSLA